MAHIYHIAGLFHLYEFHISMVIIIKNWPESFPENGMQSRPYLLTSNFVLYQNWWSTICLHQ